MAAGLVSKKASIATFNANTKALPRVADLEAAPGKSVAFYVPMPKRSARLAGPFKRSAAALPTVDQSMATHAATPGKAVAFYVPMPKRSARLVGPFKRSANLPSVDDAMKVVDSKKPVKFWVPATKPVPSKEFLSSHKALPVVRKANKKTKAFWVPM